MDEIDVEWGKVTHNKTGKVYKDVIMTGTNASSWDWSVFDTHHRPGIQIAEILYNCLETTKTIILSSGYDDKLQVDPNVLSELKKLKFNVFYLNTSQAVEKYNKLVKQHGDAVIAFIHSTC